MDSFLLTFYLSIIRVVDNRFFLLQVFCCVPCFANKRNNDLKQQNDVYKRRITFVRYLHVHRYQSNENVLSHILTLKRAQYFQLLLLSMENALMGFSIYPSQSDVLYRLKGRQQQNYPHMHHRQVISVWHLKRTCSIENCIHGALRIS